MEREENGEDLYFEKWYYEPVLVVPRVVRRVSPGHLGIEYNEVILEPVTLEQMQEIKRQQGKNHDTGR